jgi:hypothetical protein
VDNAPFAINTMDLQQPKVLVWPHQAEATKGKNVVIREAKSDMRGKELVTTPSEIISYYRLNHSIWSLSDNKESSR